MSIQEISKYFWKYENLYLFQFFVTSTPLPATTSGVRGCTYTEGVCAIHGEGAILKWRPVSTPGRRGGARKGWKKEYYHECDVGLSGKKLRQPRLFFKTEKGDDTTH